MGYIPKNLSVALFFQGQWVEDLPLQLRPCYHLVHTAIFFSASQLSFAACSPSHDASFGLQLLRIASVFALIFNVHFLSFKNLWQSQEEESFMDDSLPHKHSNLLNIRAVRQNHISLNLPGYALYCDESFQPHKAGSKH